MGNASVEEVDQILNAPVPEFSEFTECQLEQVRAELFNSLGTCSFDDPREDLRGMGLLKDST